MNIRRGFFRLWICISVCWILASGWVLRDDLYFGEPWTMTRSDCPSDIDKTRPLSEWTDQEIECVLSTHYWANRWEAAKTVFLPPLGLLVLGGLIGWIIQGFRPKSK
jgi:hypothetical protein